MLSDAFAAKKIRLEGIGPKINDEQPRNRFFAYWVKINSFLATPIVCVKTEANRNMQEMPSKAGSPVMAVAPMKQEGLLNLLFALQCLDLGPGAR